MKNQLENKKGIIFNESFEIFKIFIENLSNMKNINNKNLNLSKLYSNDYVKIFLRYNANKALMNLRFPPLFPDQAEDVNPIVLNGLSTKTSNHDFFSSTGNGYLITPAEEMRDEDYDY